MSGSGEAAPKTAKHAGCHEKPLLLETLPPGCKNQPEREARGFPPGRTFGNGANITAALPNRAFCDQRRPTETASGILRPMPEIQMAHSIGSHGKGKRTDRGSADSGEAENWGILRAAACPKPGVGTVRPRCGTLGSGRFFPNSLRQNAPNLHPNHKTEPQETGQ